MAKKNWQMRGKAEIFRTFLTMPAEGLVWANKEPDYFTADEHQVFEAMVAMAEDQVMSPNVKSHPMREG